MLPHIRAQSNFYDDKSIRGIFPKRAFFKLHFLLQGPASYPFPFISNRKCIHNVFWGLLMRGHHWCVDTPFLAFSSIADYTSVSVSVPKFEFFLCHTFCLSLRSTCSPFSFWLPFSLILSIISFNLNYVSLKLNLSRWKLHLVFHTVYFCLLSIIPLSFSHLLFFTSLLFHPCHSLYLTLKADLTPYKMLWILYCYVCGIYQLMYGKSFELKIRCKLSVCVFVCIPVTFIYAGSC